MRGTDGACHEDRRIRELERRNEVLSELFKLAAALSEGHDVEALLKIVGSRLVLAVDASHCDIYRREADAYRCVVSASRDGFLTSYERELLDLSRNPTGAAALRDGRPLVIADVEGSELTDHEKASLLAQGLRSELCIPLAAGGETIGFIDLFDVRPRDWRDCSELAAGVGRLVAGGLENARLLERLEQRNRELAMLVEGGLEFGATLDTELVLQSIARRMREAMSAGASDIYTVREGVARIVASVDVQGSPDASDLGMEYAVAGRPLVGAALEGTPVVVEDILVDPRASDLERRSWAAFGLRSGVVVPLINGAEPVGVAAIYDREPRVFRHVDLLLGLGQVAGQAIANARLYEALERSAERAALLNEVGAEVSGQLDAEGLLHTVVRRLRAVTGVSEAAAYLLDGERLRCVAADSGELPIAGIAVGRSMDLSVRPVARLVVSEGKTAAIASLDDPRVDAVGRAWLRGYEVRSYVITPLFAQGSVVGTVELIQTHDERLFSPEEIGLVEAVCRVAGLAMDNALLFADLATRNREAELLNQIAGKTAASLDLSEIVEAAVEGLRDLAAIDTYGLSLVEDGRFVTVHSSSSSDPPRSVHAEGDGMAALLEQVARERVVVSDDVSGVGRLSGLPGGAGSRETALVGLFRGADLVGVLMLGSSKPGAFAGVDLGILERVGVHLSLASHNARLYQEIKALHLSNLKGLSTALNAKDYYTLGHAARVAAYIVLLGEELGWDAESLDLVRDAAYLHDIGKIGVSDRVLLKQGPLNPEEWELMRQHPTLSADIIRPLFPPALVDAVRHHHERFDGKGYPDGLSGMTIPELARAMCVVDSYDAMSLQRPYRSALSAEDCRAELMRCSGGQFDPAMVTAFLRVLERLAGSRGVAVRAAAEAAAHIDPTVHAALQLECDVESEAYVEVQTALRRVRDGFPEVRFMTTEARLDQRVVIVVDADETDSPDYSVPGEEVMADDAAQQVLSGHAVDNNVLFVDNYGVWVNGLAPLIDEDGGIVAVVAADVPALDASEAHGFARMTSETPVSTLQDAAVRLSRAEIEAITDGLTGLYNHRRLHEALTEQVFRARSESASLSLLFCDLDFFKQYNDRLGHAAGDEALRSTARIIESCTRRADLVGRYGGEEFVVLLPGAARPEALAIAGRIRAAVAERHREAGGLTISIGVATYPDDASDKESLLSVADQAMYTAKRLGRDRVVAAGE